MKIEAADVWPLVLDFIKNYVGKAQLKAFKEHFAVEVEQSEDILVKAGGMQALMAAFFKQNKAAYKQFVKAQKANGKTKSKAKKDESDSSSSEEETPVKAKKKDSTLAGKKRKRSDSQTSEKSGKASKRQRAESVTSVKSNGSGPVTRRKASMDADAAAAEVEKETKPAGDYHFKRINASKFTDKIQSHFIDNSFEAKARFGQGGDSYGAWSNSKLHDKKGASFIKEKNKMKNRQSHASGSFNT